jgi:hypothetical protein
MTVGLNNTALLDLPLPVEGYFDGSWGDLVNNALTNYLDIAIAGTLILTGDSAVTLDNTAGDDSASNISSTSAQYAAIKVTTTTTAKIITVGTAGSPAVSKIYIIDNAGTGGAVTFKAYGQTGISVAVGEKCVVYFNGTDFVKVASSVADGVTSVGGTGTVNGITLTGTVTSTGNLTLGGTLANVNLTSQVTGTLPVANGGTGITSLGTGVATFLGTPSSANLAAAVTDETGSGSLVFATSPTLAGTPLAPTASTGANTTQIATTAFVQNSISAIAAGVTSFSGGSTGLTPSTGTTGAVTLGGILDVDNGGTGTATPALVAGTNVTITGTWPNQTINSTNSGGTVTAVTASLPITSSGGTTPNLTFLAPGTAGNVLTSTGSAWASSPSAGGSVAGGAIYMNTTVISQNYTFAAGSNGMSVGPITIDSGYAITVTSGQRWVIL